MRHTIRVILLLSGLYSYSQLYIPSGTVFTLDGLETQISSNESINTINTTISGQGTLVFNRNSEQVLTSTQSVLILPNLVLKNADLLRIETVVSVQNKLFIYEGELVLLHDLHLQDNTSLVLFNESKIKETEQGEIVINSNLLDFFHPIAYSSNTPTIVFVNTQSSSKTTSPLFTTALRANFDLNTMNNYIFYIIQPTPPPKIS